MIRKRPVLESSIVRAVMKDAKTHPGLVLRKRHGTVMGVAGDPDLTGCFRGRHIEIEVKRPGEDPTELQLRRLVEWKGAGAITGVARSVDDYREILGFGRRSLPPERLAWLCEGCGAYSWQGAEAPARCPQCGHLHFKRVPCMEDCA